MTYVNTPSPAAIALLGNPCLPVPPAIVAGAESIATVSRDYARAIGWDTYTPLSTSALIGGLDLSKVRSATRNIALPAGGPLIQAILRRDSISIPGDEIKQGNADLILIASAALLAAGVVPLITDRLKIELSRSDRHREVLPMLEGIARFLETDAFAGQRDISVPHATLDWNHPSSIDVTMERGTSDSNTRILLARGAAMLFGLTHTFEGFDGVPIGLSSDFRTVPGAPKGLQRKVATYQYGDGVLVVVNDHWKEDAKDTPDNLFVLPRILAQHWRLRNEDNRRTLDYLSSVTGRDEMTEIRVARNVSRYHRGDICAMYEAFIPLDLKSGSNAITLRVERGSGKKAVRDHIDELIDVAMRRISPKPSPRVPKGFKKGEDDPRVFTLGYRVRSPLSPDQGE